MATKIGVKSSVYSFRRLKPDSKHLDTIRKEISDMSSKSSKKLQNIEKQANRTCRMLFNGKDLVGFVIYKRKPQTIAQYLESLKLEVFTWLPKSTESDRKELLNRAIQLAEDRSAKHLHIKLSKAKFVAAAFFESNGFKKDASYTKSNLFIRDIKDQQNGVRNEKAEAAEQADQIERKSVKRRRPEQEERVHTDAHQDKRLKPDIRAMPTLTAHNSRSSSSQYYERSYSILHAPTQQPTSGPYYDSNQHYNRKPQHHELTLRKMYIHQIQSGRKTVEGRINSGVVKRYRIGDTIRFFYKQNQSDDVVCKITDIRIFRTFRDMLIDSGYNKCVSETRSLDHAENIYLSIPGYPERAAQHGVVALHLQVVPIHLYNP